MIVKKTHATFSTNQVQTKTGRAFLSRLFSRLMTFVFHWFLFNFSFELIGRYSKFGVGVVLKH